MNNTLSDKDLLSVQEARTLAEQAHDAYNIFAEFSQDAIDKVVRAVAVAAFTASDKLARQAADESGFGKYEDKIQKNIFASREVYHSIKDMKTVGIINEIPEKKIFEIAEPMGVVAGLTPSTNPTSTAIYKALISIKARNAIVIAPHPSASKCVYETAKIMSAAAEKAGAPHNLIQCMQINTLPGTTELMTHSKTNVILATGGMGVVRAAYSSGKPAYGVGPGNVPAYVDRTANIQKAISDIVIGKTFDYGTICASEQSIVCDRPVTEQAIQELKKQKCYLCDDDDRIKLEKAMMLPNGAISPKVVGKPAKYIADKAGIKVPEGTRVLVVFLEGVGKDYPLSCEKLSPVLSFYSVDGWEAGCEKSKEILNFGGMGHTLSIHCQDDEIIKEFGLKKPAFRICVNTPSTLGAIGFTTSVAPAMTLGPGTFAGSITSENISPKNLMHIKRLAYETKPLTNDPVDLSVSAFDKPIKVAKGPKSYTSTGSSCAYNSGAKNGSGKYSRFDDMPINVGTRKSASQPIDTSKIDDSDIEKILEQFRRGRS